MSNNIGTEAYNKFEAYARFSYNCISYLINNNDLVWDLLKYNQPDAWSKPSLTYAEKTAMIYQGQEDDSMFRVFMDIKQPDVFTSEIAILRISPYFAAGLNRTLGIVEMSMEIFCHHKINHLNNYQTRTDTITGELLKVFNGADVGGLGLLFFDKMGDQSSRLINTGQIPFGGKQIIFSTHVA